MTTRISTPQSRCRAAFARCDITPPVGIYHRMWGAALHDRATGVHRPLEATLLWLEPEPPATGEPRVLVSLDHCILDTSEMQSIRAAIGAAAHIPGDNVFVTLTHTHGSGWMSRTRSALPGGEHIGPYLDGLVTRLAELARDALPQVASASIVYGRGRCTLAAHRDFFDPGNQQFVCGLNPDGPADDTLIVGRVTGEDGTLLGTMVNYACHPTTLAWGNTLISPDWVGAMRETVEQSTGAPCLFLQGASGDLGPREGFVGETEVADRNGRQVAHAALSALVALPPPGVEFCYMGPVVSGATIGTWRYEPLPADCSERLKQWRWQPQVVELPYRADLPTIEQTTAEREHWLAEEARARGTGDERRLRDCRAQVEQRTRQLARLNALAPGQSYPLKVEIARLGNAVWIFTPGELYQVFQTALRERLAPRPVVVATLANDWQPGYIPPAGTYGRGIYQEVIAATAPGALETLIDAVASAAVAMANGER